MHRIINHFTDDDLYKFTMCCAVIENYPRTRVRYRFTDRDHTAYPPGFAAELLKQVAMLEDIEMTAAERDFMRERCRYIPAWFYDYLKGFRYRKEWVQARQDSEGHLEVEIEGPWSGTILLEVKLLAIISELYYTMTGIASGLDYDAFAKRSYEKGRRLIEGGCTFSDFGTRRRATFRAQQCALEAMCQAARDVQGSGRLAGTSNVYLAMKHDLTPTGTMAHELICALAGMYGPLMANHLAMDTWRHTFRGALGTFLYDTYGWRIFSLNFSEDYANMFKGLRVDSGDNYHELDLIVEKYKSLGIDASTKQVVFSNGLDVDEAISIERYAAGKCIPSFGIGTHFTNDFPGVRPRNIVIKLTDVKITESWPFYSPTCKLSEDRGKYSGDAQTVARFLATLHLNED